ncbi:hypothetical protein, partial [Mycolicibacterium sp.]|uniref:hypothetical protein n=1 Tax=Mycolicibacterium sp. TaxID=2320850 RepID=UPI003D105DD3
MGKRSSRGFTSLSTRRLYDLATTNAPTPRPAVCWWQGIGGVATRQKVRAIPMNRNDFTREHADDLYVDMATDEQLEG